ncbi:MAG: hypothetical protein EA398_11655 [Deltaproteobacteria bacterium]|nr:MAG: hypothetical protein EA398_11655 [Deltaproteobacteria bacterium]
MSEAPPQRTVIDSAALLGLSRLLESAVLQLHEPAVGWSPLEPEPVRMRPLSSLLLRTLAADARPEPADVLACLAADGAGVVSLVTSHTGARGPGTPATGLPQASTRVVEAINALRGGCLAIGKMIAGPPAVVEHEDGSRSPAENTLLLTKPRHGAHRGACLYWRMSNTPTDAALLPLHMAKHQSQRCAHLFSQAPWQSLPEPWQEPFRTLALLDRTGQALPSFPRGTATTEEASKQAALRLRTLGEGPVFGRVPSTQLPVVAALADTDAARWLLCRTLQTLSAIKAGRGLDTTDLLQPSGDVLAAIAHCGWTIDGADHWHRILESPHTTGAFAGHLPSERLAHVLQLCRRDGPFALGTRWDSLIEATHLLRPDLLEAPFLPASRGSKGYPLFRTALATGELPEDAPLPLGGLPRHHRDVLALHGIGQNRFSQLTRSLHHSLSRALARSPQAPAATAGPDLALSEGLDSLQQLFRGSG